MLIAVWYAAVGLLTILALQFELPDPETAVTFEQLDFKPLDNIADPAAAPSWRQVDLPDNWRSSPARLDSQGLYRGVFAGPADPDEPWAVHIPSFSSHLLMYINGTLVGESLPYGAAPPLDQPLPLMARISPSILQSGQNVIEIQLTASGMKAGFLDRVLVGPEETLRPYQSLRWFATITVPQLLIVWEMILAAGMFALWYNRPSELAYGLFCGILAWAILNGLPLVLVDLPLPKGVWGRLGYLADIWQAFLSVPFAYYFMNRSPPIPLRWHLALPIAVTVASILVSEPVFKLMVLWIILPFGVAALIWCVAVLMRGAFGDGNIGAHLILASLIAVVTFTIHDVLIIYNVIETHITYLLRYSFLLVVTCISGIFLYRFITSLNAVDRLSSSLERRLLDQEHELRANFSAERADERRRDLEDERIRLMRDMHDGLGGQLVSIVSLAEGQAQTEDLAAAARTALEDLRMIIASLDIDEGDLSALLGMFRERIERQLAAADIELDWQMSALPEIDGLDPEAAMHILRILQEAITNVVKHAGATEVQIQVLHRPDKTGGNVHIDVADNGRGGISSRQGGNGIANMRARAEALKAKLLIASAERCSRIRLILPLRLSNEQESEAEEAAAAYPISMGY